MGIKTVVFEKNAHGITDLQIDTSNQTIHRPCIGLLHIAGRHYRLDGKHGKRIAYKERDKYLEIQVDIKEIK